MVILKNSELEVELNAKGAEIIKIIGQHDQINYMWRRDPSLWASSAPILFPIVGALHNDECRIDGQTYHMTQHGFSRHNEYMTHQLSDTCVEFELTPNEDILKQYPYLFNLKVIYTLKGNTLECQCVVKNTDQKTIYFQIGGHPAFACPFMENESSNDYYVEFEKEETLTIPTPIKQSGLIDFDKRFEFMQNQRFISLSYQLFFVDSLILDQIQSRNVKLKSKKSNYQVEVSFEDFKYLVLWTSANHGPFIAIEPWNGLSTGLDESDIFDEKRNIQYVEPNHTNVYSYSINIISAK